MIHCDHSSMTYLDNNATTQVADEVLEAMLPWLREEYGNPSSSYALGKRAAGALEEARARVAALVGCSEDGLIFTSCGTESINAAVLSCISRDPDRRHIVTSTVEHSATVKLCERLARQGYEITWLPVDAQGLLDPARVEDALREDTAVISLLWANNETGVIFPVEEIARIATHRGVPLHIDAVQAAGKVSLTVRELGIPFLSISGHKLHCPKGVGALAVSKKVRFTPLFAGSQEDGRRGGTQNMASIVGFGKAAELALKDREATTARIQSQRDRFESHMLATLPGCEVNGHPTLRLPNTANLSFAGLESEAALLLLGERGICCSAGSACTSGSVHPSHVLRAMGMTNERARSSLRFSFGRLSTEADLATACEIVPQVVHKLRSLATGPGPVVMA